MSTPTVLPTAGFSTIDNDVLLNPKISIEAKATLALLKYFDRGTDRGCFARKETLCRFLSVSPYRLRKALAELKDLGLITITRPGQGHPDIIRVVRQEEPQKPEPLQVDVEQVGEELQEELDRVVEEPLEVVHEEPPEPLEKSDDSDSHAVEIQTGDILPEEHYKEENKYKNINTLNPCDELISYFYTLKENRQPSQNEIANWTSTARRLLKEFTLEELKPAVENAIDQGARLFYFVALTGPAYIVKKRQQQQIELQHAQIDSTAIEAQNEREHRLEALKRSAREFDAQTQNLLVGLEAKIRPQSFRTWFKDTFITNVTEDTLTLAVASDSAAEWITQRYTALLQEISGKDHIEFIAG